jgi:hypothetical protein
VALISGDLAKADELCAILYRSLDKDGVDDNAALTIVREGVFTFKTRLINQFLRGNYGIDFDTLQTKGKDIYSETLLEQIHRDVGDIDIGVDLIVTGFVESDDYATGEKLLDPCIIRVLGTNNQPLDVALHNSFACIGEGAASASASLLYREHSDDWTLKRTTYAVYEAKTLAEILPSVGEATTIYIQSEDEPLRFISKRGFSRCRKMFANFGPKKITAKALKEFALSLEDYEDDVDPPAQSKDKPLPVPPEDQPMD